MARYVGRRPCTEVCLRCTIIPLEPSTSAPSSHVSRALRSLELAFIRRRLHSIQPPLDFRCALRSPVCIEASDIACAAMRESYLDAGALCGRVRKCLVR
jgi:hypothetical protein